MEHTDYLVSLKKEWLRDQELIVAAEYLKKTMILYQPGHGNDSNRIGVETFNEGASEPIRIYFNGRDHYERVELVDAD